MIASRSLRILTNELLEIIIHELEVECKKFLQLKIKSDQSLSHVTKAVSVNVQTDKQ